MKRHFISLQLSIIFISILITSSCIKVKYKIPILSTNNVSVVTPMSAVCNYNITSDGGKIITAHGICWGSTPNFTISDGKTEITPANNSEASFNSLMTGLTANATYYVRAYATNSIGTGYGNELTINVSQETGTVTDYDGNTYQTVKIGNQFWMAENLKVTHYRNGDPINNAIAIGAWYSVSGVCCDYNYDVNNCSTYGKLYNWYAVSDSRNIAPSGWHIPSDNEWAILISNLGGLSVAGGKLKEAGTTHWNSPNTGATNESGFRGLPAGDVANSGTCSHLHGLSCWWSSTECYTNFVWTFVLNSSNAKLVRSNDTKLSGASIRCIMD